MNLQQLAAAVMRPQGSRIQHGRSQDSRIVVGIAGPPGAGKTTLARALCAATGFAHAPGDGFIIDESYTDAGGAYRDRGSVSGFDTEGYAALLRDIRDRHGIADVTVPNYRHTQDGSGADSWVVPAASAGVVTECNFIGSASHGWPEVRAQLTWLVYLDQTWDVCRPRLLARQLAKGRTEGQAATRVDTHDRDNYNEAALAAPEAHFVISGDSGVGSLPEG